jgi:heterodisulfide reductase subunit A
VSSYQLERMLHPDGPTHGALRGAGGRPPRSVLLAPDGDADGELAPLELLKLAQLVRARAPAARVAVAGGLEGVPRLRRRTAELAADGVQFLAGRLARDGVSAEGGALRVRLEQGTETAWTADLVVIHAAARARPGSDALARLLRIPAGERGFLLDRAASPFEPTATRIAGIHVAGAAAGPRTIADAIRDGAAAAGLVHASLVPGERRPVEPLRAEVDDARCGGCAICAAVCPFGAIQLGPGQLGPSSAGPAARKARVDAVHCRGCGTCVAACPTGAASANHFTQAQLAAEISALLALEADAAGGG